MPATSQGLYFVWDIVQYKPPSPLFLSPADNIIRNTITTTVIDTFKEAMDT